MTQALSAFEKDAGRTSGRPSRAFGYSKRYWRL